MRWITSVLCAISATSLWGGEVSVSHVHLCCGSCLSAVDDALSDVAGVSDVAADQNTKTIRFTAADDKAAEAGIKALARHGFFGQAKHGSKKLEFPPSGAKMGEKSNLIELYGVHLCCGACVTGAKKALENVGGLSAIEIDRAGGKITLNGAGMETTKALDALNAGGFYALLKKNEEPKKDAPEKAK
jgi:mercuric ion binding protein